VRISSLVDQKIKDAIERGDFDNLSNKGKPIDFKPWRNTPQHLRMSYRVLKSAGITPPEVQLKQDIADIRQKLRLTQDKQEKMRLTNRLNELMVTTSIRMEKLRPK